MDILKKLPNCKVFSTVKQSEDEEAWLAARTRGIGGSDVGAICGVNKWSTARHIYFRKTGQYLDAVNDFNAAAVERMHFGHVLEPIVADEFVRKTGKKVVEAEATLVHKDHPWALANVDRLIVDDNGDPIGILECKTTSEYCNEDWKEGDVPIYYLYQLSWYLWVTGLKYGAIACIVGGNKFYYYEMYLDEELMENEIVPKCKHFWFENVRKLVPPEIDGSDAAADLVGTLHPPEAVNKEELILTDDIYNQLANAIIEGKAQLKEIEKNIKEATNRLKEVLGDNETAITKGIR